MASRSLISTITLLLSFLFFNNISYGEPAPKTNFVTRHWVVKLKQNSWLNRRPFQFASPLYDQDKIFVGVERGFFYAIDSKKGKKLWTFKTQGSIHAAAAADAENVYFADIKGNVYALKKGDGEPLWMANLLSEVMSKPLIIGEHIYFVTLSQEIFALNKKDGSLAWQTYTEPQLSNFTIKGSSDLVLFQDLLIVGYSDGMLTAHALRDGSKVWSKRLGEGLLEYRDVDASVSLAMSEDLGYVTSADGHLYAFRPKTGTIEWDAPVGSVNDVVIDGERLYVAANGILYGLLRKTGDRIWEQDFKVPEISSPLVYDSYVTTVATKGKIYFLDRLKGDILKSWYVKGGAYSDLVLGEDSLILLSNSGRLYSFSFKPKTKD